MVFTNGMGMRGGMSGENDPILVGYYTTNLKIFGLVDLHIIVYLFANT